jgi:hypothetical protein
MIVHCIPYGSSTVLGTSAWKMRKANNLIYGCRLDNMDTYSNLLYVKEQRVELAHLAHRYYMQDSYYCISMSHSKRHKQGCYLLVTWRVVSGPPRRHLVCVVGSPLLSKWSRQAI